MEYIYTKDYNKKVQEQWRRFINDEPVTPGIVRDEILTAWQKCKEMGIDPQKGVDLSLYTLPREETERLINQNRLMCDIARPFMQRIYESIPGPSSLVGLLDSTGTLIMKFDNSDNDFLQKEIYDIGCTSQNFTIPVAIETYNCARTLRPTFCFGEENYIIPSKDWGAVAAPILNDSNALLGILTLSDKVENIHWHTLGMIMSAAKAIENELSLFHQNQRIEQQAAQLSAAIESSQQGMIILDQNRRINKINSYARKILYLDSMTVEGKKIADLLKDNKGVFSACPIPAFSEREVMIKTAGGYHRYFVTVQDFITGQEENTRWTLIIVKDMNSIKKLTNTVSASSSQYKFNDIIGSSPAFLQALEFGRIAANSTSTVLITGESGTGKELFAHAIHAASSRCNGPFISLNCGALPTGLVESELFGFEGGSFTGARKEGQVGKFELADQGTIFLDEIGEMPLSVQASILRVIESKEVTRIGGTKTTHVDVRIIAATNRDLKQAMTNKEFREDLYYRLNVLRISIPPLRNRKEDIPKLADQFMKIYTRKLNKHDITLAKNTYRALLAYDWPGNVRELENIIERAVNITNNSTEITADLLNMLTNMDTPGIEQNKAENASGANNIKDMEKQLIIDTLISCNGSITKAAENIGIGRRTMYRKFEEYDIDYKSFKQR